MAALEYNQDVDVLEEIKKVTTERVVIENDAKCAAQCEVTYGSLKGTDVDAVCILGTGIGGGITIGDRVFTGGHGFTSEFSYFSTKWTEKNGFDSKWGGTDGSVLKDYTDPVAIGGGISKQPILMTYIQKSLDELYEKMPVPIPQVKLVQCKYNNDSNLIGALANYKKVD